MAAVPPIVLAVASVGALYWWVVVAWTFAAPGAVGIDFHGPGTDWMVFHGAIRAALADQWELLADGDRFTDFTNRIHAEWLHSTLDYSPWLNPPTFLVLLLPFAALPFLPSYVLFQLVGAASLAASLRCLGGRRDTSLAIVLLSPAAAVTAVEGQSAFLVAALLLGGIGLAGQRPILAGLLLGLVTFKPQFALLVPVALVASRQWRAFGAAGVGAAGLALASIALFGLQPWATWLAQSSGPMLDPDSKWTEYGRLWGDSVYASAIVAGLPGSIANLLQALATTGAAIAVYALFRSRASERAKLAGFCIATILAAPHSGFYDTILLAVAGCLLVMDRASGDVALRPWLLPLLFWLAPFVTPPALHIVGCLMPPLLAAVLWSIVADARTRGAPTTSQAGGGVEAAPRAAPGC